MAGTIVEKDLKKISVLLQTVLGVSGYAGLQRLGGLTNHTYRVTLENGEEYALRLAGEGTEALINRAEERVSTELACRLGIDAELLYFGEDGAKITRYIPDAQTMSPQTLRREENLEKAARLLRILHTSGADTGVPFDVFDMADAYERFLRSNHVSLYEDFEEIRSQVMAIKEGIDSRGKAPLVPCHNDPLCENWVLGGEKMYLIDWEYAGMNDSMWDLADVSIEASFTEDLDRKLLEAYFDRAPTGEETRRFRANKLYLDFLWTLWGKTRVPFEGEPMEQYALERYLRLKENLSRGL